MRKKYNKLIRDKIPQLCRADGWEPEYRILSTREYAPALKAKIIEEAEELVKAQGKKETLNELADVYELLLAAAKAAGITWSTVEKKRREKSKNRGGFAKRYFLISTKK